MEGYELRYQNWKNNVSDLFLKEELDSLNDSKIKERFYSTLEFGTSGLEEY